MKFISLNIERDKHLGRVLPFLKKEAADFMCIQEMLHKDFDTFKKFLVADGHYEPMALWEEKKWGIAILTPHAYSSLQKKYYWGSPETLPKHIPHVPETLNYLVLAADVRVGSEKFTAGTTHFAWAAGGGTSEMQQRLLPKLLETMKSFPELILAGDFNAPRGGEVFGAIADHYKDNIPPEYKTSIDGNLHRAGKLEYMVDGLFTTPQYRVRNIRLESGLSDHMAIVAEISRA